MKLLLRLFCLLAAFGTYALLCQTSADLLTSAEPENLALLEEQGYYPAMVYHGWPRKAGSIVTLKERWPDLRKSEEVEFFPLWEKKYSWQTVSKLLLVIDGDYVLYVADKNQGFKVVGRIKKKGLIKRTMRSVVKGLQFALDGPLHIILSIYGI